MFKVNLERVEEEMAGDYSEEEEEDILHIGKKRAYCKKRSLGN